MAGDWMRRRTGSVRMRRLGHRLVCDRYGGQEGPGRDEKSRWRTQKGIRRRNSR